MVLTMFKMVKILLTYNAIIDWPMLNKLWLIMSSYYTLIKFLIIVGIGELRSNPKESC